jgi:hypothetical protein
VFTIHYRHERQASGTLWAMQRTRNNTALTLELFYCLPPPVGRWSILKADAKNPFAHCLAIFYIIF